MTIKKIEEVLKKMPTHKIEVGFSSWGDVSPRYKEFVTIEEVVNYLKENY